MLVQRGLRGQTVSPLSPSRTVTTSPDQVSASITPSAAYPLDSWKARVALSVLAPKVPSAAMSWP